MECPAICRSRSARYIDRGALASGELSEAGLFIPEGHYFLGQFIPQDVNADWGNMQTARWTAESGLARMKAVLGPGFESNVNTPRAYLYGGFANRLLGENVCVAVIDGGPARSDTVYFQRAESLFTRAYTTGDRAEQHERRHRRAGRTRDGARVAGQLDRRRRRRRAGAGGVRLQRNLLDEHDAREPGSWSIKR